MAALIRTTILAGCTHKFSCTHCSIGDADCNAACNIVLARADCNASGPHDTSVSMKAVECEPRQIARCP